MADADDVGPIAFNSLRMSWEDLPTAVRERVDELAGSKVVAAHSTTTGFSPGFAGILDLADGERVFVKATGEAEHPFSITLNRDEIAANAALPDSVPAPRMLWSDDGAWALTGFEVIDGASPALPWKPSDLTQVFEALSDFAHTTPRAGHSLRPFKEAHADLFSMWTDFAAKPAAERKLLAERGGEWGEWALRHMDTFVDWEQGAAPLTEGESLVHADLRADNMVIDAQRKVWIVDWPWVCVGAPWIDLAFLLPSVEMQGGGVASEHFRAHPLGAEVPHETIRAGVTLMTGFFLLGSWEEPPEQIPTLRDFQRGQALPAARWLQALEPDLT